MPWRKIGEIIRSFDAPLLCPQFIELHGEPMLQRLYEAFQKEYPHIANEFRPPPATGSLDLQSVRDSIYFFS